MQARVALWAPGALMALAGLVLETGRPAPRRPPTWVDPVVRVLRVVGAVLAWLVATVLLTLAIVLSVTLVLLPVGLLLGFASLRLYRLGLKLIMPRPSDIQKGVRKELRGWWPKSLLRRLRRSTKFDKRRIVKVGKLKHRLRK